MNKKNGLVWRGLLQIDYYCGAEHPRLSKGTCARRWSVKIVWDHNTGVNYCFGSTLLRNTCFKKQLWWLQPLLRDDYFLLHCHRVQTFFSLLVKASLYTFFPCHQFPALYPYCQRCFIRQFGFRFAYSEFLSLFCLPDKQSLNPVL